MGGWNSGLLGVFGSATNTWTGPATGTFYYCSRQQAYQQALGQQQFFTVPEPPKEEGTMLNDFLIGCDPEFAILDTQGKIVNVREFCGADDKAPIGFDHSGKVVELHPTPSKGTYTLLKKL